MEDTQKVYCPECMKKSGRAKLLFKKTPDAKGVIKIMCRGCKEEVEIKLDSDKDYSPENCRWIPLSENVSRAAKKMWKERKCEDARSEQTDTRQEIVAH